MSGLVAGGVSAPLEGHRVVNYHDDPRLRLRVGQDGRRRRPRTKIAKVILHTTKGIPGGRDRRPQVILPGVGPSTDAGVRIAGFWSRGPRQSGAHLVVDHDRTIYCLADLFDEVAYHAGPANEDSIGVEIYQGADAELYYGQLEAAADLVDWITMAAGIQRQIPSGYHGGPLERFADGGRELVGVFGHRDVTARRGRGDPGDAIMMTLAGRGYQRLDFAGLEDLQVWRIRQAELGLRADGIPGPVTVASLRGRGFAGGLWACPPPRQRV